jgi:sigma-B regulation protein RsbU (phosphoserine phosphatase)
MATTTPVALRVIPMPAARRPPVLLYLTLGLVAVVTIAYQVRFDIGVIPDLRHPRHSVQIPFHSDMWPVKVSELKPEAEQAGLRKGDVVVQLAGHPVSGTRVFGMFSDMNPGDRVSVIVERNHVRHTMQIVLRPSAQPFNAAADFTISVMVGIFLPWSSVLLGLYVALARPRDPLAWLVMMLLITFSQIVNADTYNWGAWIRVAAYAFHAICFSAWPLFLFLFGYYFPDTHSIDRKTPWLKWVVLVPFVIMASVNTYAFAGVQEDLPRYGPFFNQLELIRTINGFYDLVLIALGLTLIGMKAFRAQADARRRLKLLLAGLAASLAPILTLILLSMSTKHQMDDAPVYILFPALAALLLFPLTLAYVIVVDRAMDVRMVVRQGLQYAFARRGVAVLRVLSLALFGVVGYLIAQKIQGNVVATAGLALALLAVVLVINIGMKRLAVWVDKRFFRDAYNAEAVLSELSEQVRSIRETGPLVETVCEQISSTMHVSKIAVLLESNGRFETSYSRGLEGVPMAAFAKDAGVISYLHFAKDAPRVYFDDENSWVYRTPGVDDEQRRQLANLGAELLLPLSTRDKLLGFIAAGQKRSEEPYSKADVRILSSVAAQTGLAIENAELTTAFAAEMALRERLAREVEIAREVQERLFPQSLPPTGGLDYSGICRTALGVGGDYYDFLGLANGRLGFAVADVAGKGISAALLMASLQASLRSETGRGGDLALLMTNLNRRVYEASSTNRYATFFYAEYSPGNRMLEYVNAGHNPPILMRRNGSDWDVRILEASGTVVGLLEGSTYEQARVQLISGDYLVAFTDGVSEAMNAADEEWGEERLTETIRACAESSLPAAEMMRRILSAADTFVAGAKQHDDMTLVVLRVL